MLIRLIRLSAVGTLTLFAIPTASRSLHSGSPADLAGAERGLGDSISVRVGPEVAVPLDSNSGALVEEPSVASKDSIVVVSWNDSHGGHRMLGRHDIGTAVSVNGGRTFQSLGFLPDSTSGHIPAGGDSRVVAGEHGAFVLETLGERADGTRLLIVYALEPPLYAKWRELAVVAESKVVIDKPALTRDAAGRLILAFTKDWAIVMSISADGGHTWSTPKPVSDLAKQTRSGTAVVSCGNELWIAWTDTRTVPWDEVWTAHSRDGGATFDPPSGLYALARTVKPPIGYALGPGPNALIQNDVGLSCRLEQSSPPRMELVAVEGENDQAGRPVFSRILGFERTVGDRQWSSPKDLTAPDGQATRVFQSVASTPTTRAMLFYEQHAVGTRASVDAILIIDDLQGHRTRVKLSDHPTDWRAVKGDLTYAPAQSNFGDYISLTSDGERYTAAWTDGVEGRSRIHVRRIAVVRTHGS